MTKSAMLLTGPLGLGHEMMARCCAQLLEQSMDWYHVRTHIDSQITHWRTMGKHDWAEALEQCLGLLATVRLDHPDHHVVAVAATDTVRPVQELNDPTQLRGLAERLIQLAHSGPQPISTHALPGVTILW